MREREREREKGDLVKSSYKRVMTEPQGDIPMVFLVAEFLPMECFHQDVPGLFTI